MLIFVYLIVSVRCVKSKINKLLETTSFIFIQFLPLLYSFQIIN